MNNKSLTILPVLLAGSLLLTGCEAIGAIFKAGIWTGTIGVVLILALVIFIIAKLFRRKS